MTTDGGGWVLVGRGRNGWTWDHAGQGTPEQIVDVPTGPSAFSPATLHGDTIAALLGGTSVKDLDGGVRPRRAANANGTSWQEVRWDLSILDTWSRSEEHTSELQSLMRISYAVFCLKKKK